VLSDGATFALIVGCNAGKRGWAVASNQRTLAAEAKKTILKKLTTFGFDMRDVIELSYEKCPLSISKAMQEGPCHIDGLKTIPKEERAKVLFNYSNILIKTAMFKWKFKT